jgi:competence protein ComGF
MMGRRDYIERVIFIHTLLNDIASERDEQTHHNSIAFGTSHHSRFYESFPFQNTVKVQSQIPMIAPELPAEQRCNV